jgi:protein-S-isoprenylcysteine O-methyltransferase Ste14
MDAVLLIKLAVFILASAGIVWYSIPSLRSPRSHGFWRFFVFEAVLALFLLNVDCWFCSPFAWHQIVSWTLLVISAYLVIDGVRLLKTIGKPEGSFEETTTLVKRGIYKYIRHPLYSSLLFLAWGIFFKAPSWMGGALALVASGALIATARADEAECLEKFGGEYADYIKEAKMFIPFLF